MEKVKCVLKEFSSLRIGQISLPEKVLMELRKIQEKYKKSQLKSLAKKILDSLNSFQTKSPFVLAFDSDQSNAYALTRMINNYGAISNIFNQIARKYPDFQPSAVSDFGCGPGTGVLASKSYFPIKRAVLIDASEPMLQLANELCLSVFPDLEIESHKSSNYSMQRTELVLCSFTLTEMPNDEYRKIVIEKLWSSCSDTLVIVDRGTPIGYELIAQARQHILTYAANNKEDIHIASPCSHEKSCPLMGSKRYCSFSQKVHLENFIQVIKENKNNHEDTKFSFVVFKRGLRPAAGVTLESQSHHWSKIVFPPMKKNKHVILDVCSPEGLIIRSNIPKMRGISYTHARKSYWGDLWPYK